jgi:predicted RNase H-like HicB family nuclease
MRKHYIALVHKDDAGFGVSFPNFPGAVTAAPTLDDAVKRAKQALALHLEGMAEDGEPIPPRQGQSRSGHHGIALRWHAAAFGCRFVQDDNWR